MSDAPRGDTPGDVTNEPRRPLISPVILTTLILAVLIAGGVWGWVIWSGRNTTLPPIANPQIRIGPDSGDEAEPEGDEPVGAATRPTTRPTTTKVPPMPPPVLPSFGDPPKVPAAPGDGAGNLR